MVWRWNEQLRRRDGEVAAEGKGSQGDRKVHKQPRRQEGVEAAKGASSRVRTGSPGNGDGYKKRKNIKEEVVVVC